MAASNPESNSATESTAEPKSLSEANRNKLNYLENHFEDKIKDLQDTIEELEAENTQLRREIAELKDNGGDWQ